MTYKIISRQDPENELTVYFEIDLSKMGPENITEMVEHFQSTVLDSMGVDNTLIDIKDSSDNLYRIPKYYKEYFLELDKQVDDSLEIGLEMGLGNLYPLHQETCEKFMSVFGKYQVQ